jgi:hypothetical protein
MMDAFGVERSEVSKSMGPNALKSLSAIAGTEGSAGTYAATKLAARAAGQKAARRSAAQGKTSRIGQKAAAKSRSALSSVAREPRGGSIGSMEASAAKAIRNNRPLSQKFREAAQPRGQKVLQAVGSGSRAVGTRVRAVGSSVGSGTARAARAVGSGTARATRAVGTGTARAGRTLRASMTRTPRAATPTTAAAKAPAAATGTESGTATVKNKSKFGRNTALIGGGAAIGAGGMAYSVDRNNQMMSKSAFGVTHEVTKGILPKVTRGMMEGVNPNSPRGVAMRLKIGADRATNKSDTIRRIKYADGKKAKAKVVGRAVSEGMDDLRQGSRTIAGNYYTRTRSKSGPRGYSDGATHTMESNGGLIFKPRRVDFRNTGEAVLPPNYEKTYDSGIKLTTGAKVVGGSAVAAGAGGGAYAYDKKKKNVSKSAFGVDHYVSKGISAGVIKLPTQIHYPRLGNPAKAVNAFKTGATRAKAGGSGVAGQTKRGVVGAFKSSPGTVMAAGAVGAGGVGAAGYGMNRNKRY